MGIEIERKFLVNKEKWKRVRPEHGDCITQGYIVNESDRSVRVRIKNKKGFITIKGGGDFISRSEFEYLIPKNEAEELLAQFCSKKIHKVRFEVEIGKHTWEVDEFSSPREGLLLAEIELTDEEEEFTIPDWVEEEVSGQAEYYNAAMLR